MKWDKFVGLYIYMYVWFVCENFYGIRSSLYEYMYLYIYNNFTYYIVYVHICIKLVYMSILTKYKKNTIYYIVEELVEWGRYACRGV